METRGRDIRLIPIGNSKGIRLPKNLLQKYGFQETLILEETPEGVLLRSKEESKLSWEETFKEMASEDESWDDFETTTLDGLDDNETLSQKI